MFEKTLVAGWGDMDFNAHMGNTAYLDKAVDVRMTFLSEHGFPVKKLVASRIGPVVMKDEVEYFKEVGLLENLRVTLSLAGISDDGSRFAMRNEIYRSDGQLAARVTTTGGWLDLTTRKLIRPPDELRNALNALSKTADFKALSPSVSKGRSTRC